MANKYATELEQLEKQPTPQVTPQAAPQEERIDPLEMGMGAGMAGLEGVVSAVPGMKWAQAKIAGLLGVPEEATAKEQQRLEDEHPVASTAGAFAGGAMGGLALGAGAGLATAVGQAAILAPAYKLGDIANQAQLKSSPLRIEQVAHTLFSHDTLDSMLNAAGLTVLLGSPALALEGAGMASAALRRSSVRQAGKIFEGAAQDMKLPPGGELDLGQLALEKKLLENAGRTTQLKDQAGAQMATAVEKLPVDNTFREALSAKLDKLSQDVGYNRNLKGPIRDIQQQSALLMEHEMDGTAVHEVIKGIGEKSRAAYRSGNNQAGQLYGDAAQLLRDQVKERLHIADPKAGAAYEMAIDDYHAFSKMESAAEAGAAKQFTGSDALKSVLGFGAARAAGAAIGPMGMAAAELGAAAYGVKKTAGKSFATLMDRYTMAPPMATYVKQTSQTLKALLTGTPLAAKKGAESSEDKYEKLEKVLRLSAVDPEGTTQKLRSRLDFLPPHEADAVAANVTNKLTESTLQLPPVSGPATAFGIQTGPSNRAKRDFVDKFEAKFDPYRAVASGRADLIAEAEKYNPEIVFKLKQQVLAELSARTDIPYSTKRRLSGILGVAGVPLQDPALGAKLQQIIATKRQADTQAGQMGSARQAAASMKNNKATLSRAQGILNQEGQ